MGAAGARPSATNGGALTGGFRGHDAATDTHPDIVAPIADASLDSFEVGPIGPCPGTIAGPRSVEIVATVPGSPLGDVFHYCIDATEVTNADYTSFLIAMSGKVLRQLPICDWNTDLWPLGSSDASLGRAPNEPVTGVDWCDAFLFCAWAGKFLCGQMNGGSIFFDGFSDSNESAWQNACSSDGTTQYPYGNAYDPSACAGADSTPGLKAAGASSACQTPSGVFDLSGNAWEWEDACVSTDDPSSECRVRGGSYETGAALLGCDADSTQHRTFRRDTRDPTVGFRCCAREGLPP